MRVLVQSPGEWTEVELKPGTTISIQPRVGKEVFVEIGEDGGLKMSVIQNHTKNSDVVLPLRPKK